MLPPFSRTTGYLPPGIHDSTWDEFTQRFGTNDTRKRLLAGMFAMLQNLKNAGCLTVYMDGSFITAQPLPADYDGAWDPVAVDDNLLDPVLLDFSNHRAAMKAKYLGEVFPSTSEAEPGRPFLEFFQTDRNGFAKGIVRLQLSQLP